MAKLPPDDPERARLEAQLAKKKAVKPPAPEEIAALEADMVRALMSPKPDEALCDGPNSWPLGMMQGLLETLAELDRTVKKKGFAEMKVKG